jgi:hypothetical protein
VSDGPIDFLSIDVEGYDAEVILGSGRTVLDRVQYLEFEYHNEGSWPSHHLYDIVELLNQADMTCYFAGKSRLWRLTNCWMLYYDAHVWSNVACVRRSQTRLATIMEDTFQRTLKDGKVWARSKRSQEENRDHKIFSTEQDIMVSKYIT